MTIESAQLLTPVIFAVAVAAIVIFGPRRGRMLAAEKAAVFRTLWSWISILWVGAASVYMERWLPGRFGLTYWASLGVMLGFAAVIGLLAQAVRALLERRSERATW